MVKILDKKVAEVKARELYNLLFDTTRAIWNMNFETDLEEILDVLSIEKVEGELSGEMKKAFEALGRDDVSGFLMKENETYTIFVNMNEPIYRQRFTIAHEIGHFILKHLEGEEISISFRDEHSKTGSDPKEVAANSFASELLMPREIVEHLFMMSGSVSSVAKEMGVSAMSAEFRLRKLGLIS
ncbi:MAG: ImmA/IrrE family metallo-endopeptidase [Turicibacter sp.]|nr:ImmA/IrrE family metallo-endopeptidase [Turicibacter sp.]